MKMNRRDRMVVWVSGGLLLTAALLVACDSLFDLGIVRAVGGWFAAMDIWRRIILIVLALAGVALAVMLILQPRRVNRQQPPAAVTQFGNDAASLTVEAVDQLFRRREAEARAEQIALETVSRQTIDRLTRERDDNAARLARIEDEIREREVKAAEEAKTAAEPAVPARFDEPEDDDDLDEPEDDNNLDEPEDDDDLDEPEDDDDLDEPEDDDDLDEPEDDDDLDEPEEPEEEPKWFAPVRLDKHVMPDPEEIGTEPIPEEVRPEPKETREPDDPEENNDPDEPEEPDEPAPALLPEEVSSSEPAFRHFSRRPAMKQRRRMRGVWDRKHGCATDDGGYTHG
ncbi:MAG: hypothetical protein IKP10_01345 [Clostridia bacterium]|nr:hypothetical protein [Clostridia bacterium]